MDIKTLCLGILSLGEASGYEIKQVFEDAFSHFYVASYGSIYPALADLTQAGHVTLANIEQEKRPAKKVYALTESGREIFNHALTETYPNHRVRSDFLVMMVFAHLLPEEQINRIFDTRLADIEKQIAEIESCVDDDHQSAQETPAGARFCGGFGLTVLKAGRDYIQQNRKQLLQELHQQKETKS
jgi:PadR family transcriptional regulator, regulatory protein AphA